MGETGICWDNAGTESLWSTFKHEYYYRHTFAYSTKSIAAVNNWMNLYNTSTTSLHNRNAQHPHSYEQSLNAPTMAA